MLFVDKGIHGKKRFEYKEVFFHHDSWNKLPQSGCAVPILGGFQDRIKP